MVNKMISLIAAMDRNRVIGKDNTLPWKLPADMKHFFDLTRGKPVIMGRKTFESVGKPLKDRNKIILTRNQDFIVDSCVVVHSVEEAIKAAEESAEGEEIMIAGGASVYEEFLPKAQRMYLTFIDELFDGDAFFPFFDPMEWEEVSRELHKKDEENPYDYAFVMLERK